MNIKCLFGWMGIAALLASPSCASDPEDFCASWVEDTCAALTTCCDKGTMFDEQACRLDLSRSCQNTTEVERVHAGELVFDSGAASDCFGSIASCEDLQAARADDSFERNAVCASMLSGFRPLGAACGSPRDCEQTGEFTTCHGGGGSDQNGVCATVVLDEVECGFSFDTNELRVCPEGKYCDRTGFTPNSSDPPFPPNSSDPPVRARFEFQAKCVNDVVEGKSCFSDGQVLSCAKGLYCDRIGTVEATCQPRKSEGSDCRFFGECVEGLSCEFDPDGGRETCQKVVENNGSYCFNPNPAG
jgi:hypothetical protein